MRARGAHALGRLPAHVRPLWLQQLPDGSALAYLAPGGAGRSDPHARLLVRVVTYRVRPPGAPLDAPTDAQPRPETIYRLVTTLLDPLQAPAERLAALYQARWAIEETFDELDTHLRLATRPLRSQTPVGVRQELYGLLLAHYAVRATMYTACTPPPSRPSKPLTG